MMVSKSNGAAAALVLVGALLAGATGAQAERAGVAAAVNTLTQGKPPGGTTRQIILGQDVLHNEVIETDANGQAQILMLDRTALTIGPNSTLVIDKFIYDPSAKSGELNLTLKRGLMRFTGGTLSKKKPVNVKTPVATVGIRGGMGLIEVSSGDRMSAGFLFGDEMTVSIGSAIARRIERPGFGTSVSDGEASAPRRWDSEKVANLMRKLQGTAGRTGGLARQPSAGRTNKALKENLPPQDGKALNDAINQVFSNTEVLQKGDVNTIYNTANQSRPYNDMPQPQSPIDGWDNYCMIAGCSFPFPGGYDSFTPNILTDFFVWLGSHPDIPDYDRNFIPAETVNWLTNNQAKFARYWTPEQIQDWFINYSTMDVGTQRSQIMGHERRGGNGVAGGGAHPRRMRSANRNIQDVVRQRARKHGGLRSRSAPRNHSMPGAIQ